MFIYCKKIELLIRVYHIISALKQDINVHAKYEKQQNCRT